MSQGLLSNIVKQLSQMGLNIKPTLVNNELTIVFTEQEFKEATTRGLDPVAKQAISIKFQDGKMIIKIKLF